MKKCKEQIEKNNIKKGRKNMGEISYNYNLDSLSYAIDQDVAIKLIKNLVISV